MAESEIFVLLANRQRRLLLRVLQESTTPLRTITLAKRMAERAYENPTVEDRRTIYLSLYHNHLPRLEEADVIVHHGDEGTIVPDVNFDDVVRILESAHEQDLPWSDG